MMQYLKRLGLYTSVAALLTVAVATASYFSTASAADVPANGDFSLQITPSPLVTDLRPGQTTELELKIRNAGTSTEDLKIEPRSFKIDGTSGQVQLEDTAPADVSSWISFASPNFSVQPGQWYTQKVRFSLPKDTGFSYSFALVISRQKDPKPVNGGRLIRGSVAVFTLINVDRPGATRKINIAQFSTTRKVYEYLPATLNVSIKNTGNTIVQPYGNIFIQRGSQAKTPIATLPVNETKGYILPGATRILSSEWSNGLPSYKTETAADGTTKTHLVWDWGNARLSSFRIGRYTAKLVAVYSDGRRDVPIEGELTFWVVPWKILLVLFVVLAVFVTLTVIAGTWYWRYWRPIRKEMKVARKAAIAKHKEGKNHD